MHLPCRAAAGLGRRKNRPIVCMMWKEPDVPMTKIKEPRNVIVEH